MQLTKHPSYYVVDVWSHLKTENVALNYAIYNCEKILLYPYIFSDIAFQFFFQYCKSLIPRFPYY
jgi:hypothetical protein